MPAQASLLPPSSLISQITVVAQCVLAVPAVLALRSVVDRKLLLISACAHTCGCLCVRVSVCVCALGNNNHFWSFSVTLTLVCQEYTNMQRGKKKVVYCAICINCEYEEQSFLSLKYSSIYQFHCYTMCS